MLQKLKVKLFRPRKLTALDKKRRRLRDAFGSSGRQLFLRTFFGVAKRLSLLTDAQVEELCKRTSRIRTIYDFGDGWETMTCAEIALGESLSGHVHELRQAEAFRLVKNFAGQLTPLIHTERASQTLHLSSDWLDAFGLITRYGYKLQYPYMLKYLNEAGIERKSILRWDGVTIYVYRVEEAVRYLDNILSGHTRREGKTTGRFPGQRNADKHLIGGWAINKNLVTQ